MEKDVSKKTNLIIVAQFGKTKGIKGEINVRCFFAKPRDILKYKDFFLKNLNRIPVKFISFNIKFQLRLKKLTHWKLQKNLQENTYIEKESLPKLKKNEFYYNDLEA